MWISVTDEWLALIVYVRVDKVTATIWMQLVWVWVSVVSWDNGRTSYNFMTTLIQ